MIAFLRSYRELLVVSVCAAVVAFLFTWRNFLQIENWGICDWDQHLAYHEVTRRTILQYGEIPLWNPYNSGGFPDLANAQSRVLSPTFVLILLFGTAPGIKLDILVHCALGLVFTYYLARRIQLERIAAAGCAGIFMLSGLYVYPLTFGMTWNLAVAYVPLLFLGYLMARETLGHAWIGGVALALMLFSGGAYILAISVVTITFWTLIATVVSRNFRSLFALVCCGLWGVGLSAVKLIPAIQLMAAHPRKIEDISGYSLCGLLYSLFGRGQSEDPYPFSGDSWFWNAIVYDHDENYMYVGLIAAVLFIAGVVKDAKKVTAFLAVMIVSLLFMAGNAVPYSLWTVLHDLPILSSMRVAQRFRIPFLLNFAIVAGFGLNWICLKWKWFSMLLVAVIFADLLWVNGSVFSHAFPFAPVQWRTPGEFRQISDSVFYDTKGIITEPRSPESYRPVFSGLMPPLLSNVGVLHAWESALLVSNNTPEPTDVLAYSDKRYRGEVYIVHGSGRADIMNWSPNFVRVRYVTEQDAILILNQNFDSGWKCSNTSQVVRWSPRVESGEVNDHHMGGLIGFPIERGSGELLLYYSPQSFWSGLVISTISIGALLIYLLRFRMKVWRQRNGFPLS
ncbi:MAG: hypothetical protein ACKVS6_17215 [Planctomycetota bacterium]